jgi:hypothetical protein
MKPGGSFVILEEACAFNDGVEDACQMGKPFDGIVNEKSYCYVLDRLESG